jgi:hypothetical protein
MKGIATFLICLALLFTSPLISHQHTLTALAREAASDTSSSAVSLSVQNWTEFPAILISPSQMTFVPQLIKSRGLPQKVMIYNTGGENLHFNWDFTGQWFWIAKTDCVGQLASLSSCSVYLEFQSETPGYFTGSMTVWSTTCCDHQVLTLIGLAYEMSMTPTRPSRPSRDVNPVIVGSVATPPSTISSTAAAPTSSDVARSITVQSPVASVPTAPKSPTVKRRPGKLVGK